MNNHSPRTRTLFKVLFLTALVVGTVLALIPSSGMGVKHLDKVQHALAFFSLAALLDMASLRRFWQWKVPLLLGYGAMIEVLQAFLPWRSFSVADWFADALGIGIYWLVWWWLLKHRLPHR
jgi:VanZ family protein